MKKIKLTLQRGDVVSAWQTDTPGLAAWNHTDIGQIEWTEGKKAFDVGLWQRAWVLCGAAASLVNPNMLNHPPLKRAWQLIHAPSGLIVCSASKREDCVRYADMLDGITDWDVPRAEIPSTSLRIAYDRINEYDAEQARTAREAA